MEAIERRAARPQPDLYPGLVARWSEGFLRSYLSRIEVGCISLRRPDHATEQFGDPEAALRADIDVDDWRFFRRTIVGGDIGFAESFIDGDWSTDDLTTLIRILADNRDRLDDLDIAAALPRRLLARAYHLSRANTLAGNRRNIEDHYDLGNEFFALFLDPSMTYSSAVFPSGNESLAEGQRKKIETIIDKAGVRPSDHVLEIGSGWGSFAISAARRTGCRVTTITLSRRQYDHVLRLVAETGLTHRVEVQLRDYREVRGQFDKIVSIEMLEAVGHENLTTYFRTCERLLAPGGRAVIQVITIRDDLYDAYRNGCDFIQRYIFPGGHLPCWGALSVAISASPELVVENVENIGHHYALTLAEWRRAFLARVDDLRIQGFDDAFIRKWTYYFSYCEAGFLSRMLGNLQVVLGKRLP